MDVSPKTGLPAFKLFPEEQVLNIQREHWVVLTAPLLTNILFILVAVSIITTPFLYNYIKIPVVVSAVTFAVLAGVSFLIALAVFNFMEWFYQYYIITSERIIHIHFFRLGGFHMDEVFHKQTKPLEIDRNAQNMFYDFLGIEDVYIYFHRAERPEPFIFKTPQDTNSIEELLEGHSIAIRRGD